ncbi:MAG: nucleotidyltransferase family protein [Fulvivirga sp.]|nr:nucleotidyltransferase family protein [Fulvivirga sp.]
MEEIGIIILAAGNSSRMSNYKQLLRLDHISLLRRSVNVALSTGLPTVTVLGANFKEHKKQIENMDTEVTFNLDWKKGMGSSLKQGLTYLHKNHPTLHGALFMACDQPMLSTSVLQQMIDAFQKGHDLIAAAYADTFGIPVLFGRKYFKELLKIDDHEGAKILIKKYEAYPVVFPEGAVDIDTDQDWMKFKKENNFD